jgi:hypothetical protein
MILRDLVTMVTVALMSQVIVASAAQAIVFAPKSQLADPTPEELVARLTDPKLSFKERCAAEDALAKMKPETVLPKLVPQRAKGMPPGGIWNSAGREADQKAPVPWQIYYAVARAWNDQIKALPVKEGGKVLLNLLKATTKDKEKYHVIYALSLRWESTAEAELGKLLRDAAAPSELRRVAALALIQHGAEDYRDTMLQAVSKAGHAEKVQWYELLSDPVHKKRKGVDPRVSQLGFQLIQAEKAKSPDYIHGAYFLALKTGAYVGEEFAPSPNDPRYQNKKGGSSDEYFVDTVRNALRWWDKNRQDVEKKSTPG